MLAWLKRLGTPPVFADQESSRAARMLYILLYILAPAAAVILLNNMLIGELLTVYALALAELILLGVLWLTRRGRVQWAGMVLVLVLLVVVTYSLQSAAGLHDIGIATYPLIVVAASLLLNRRNFFIAMGLTITAVGWLAFGEMEGLFTPLVPARDTIPSDFVTATVILGVTAITARLMATNLVRGLEQAQTEIAERKLAEDALRDSEERFRELGELLPEIVYEMDDQGMVTFVNRQTYEITGYSQEDLERGFEGVTLYIPQDRERARQNIRALMAGQPTDGAEFTAQRKDGSTFPVLSRAAPIVREGRAVGVRGVIVDITERKRAEDEVRRFNQELEQRVAERTAQLESANRELDAFAHSVSHDLRAPLRAMSGYSTILLDECSEHVSEDAQRYLHHVQDSVHHMQELIDDLLAFSRLGRQDLVKQNVLPRELVDQVLRDLLAEQGEHHVEVVVGDLPPCRADPSLLWLVYLNLLSNALKFTRGRNPARIEVGCAREDGTDIYYVRDNGVGFDMRYANKLFGVFQRLHSPQEYEGTGVGLATVQRIVRRHDGRAWAKGEVDAGATFYFTLNEEGM